MTAKKDNGIKFFISGNGLKLPKIECECNGCGHSVTLYQERIENSLNGYYQHRLCGHIQKLVEVKEGKK